jgi:histidyl-tRNA synthetase
MHRIISPVNAMAAKKAQSKKLVRTEEEEAQRLPLVRGLRGMRDHFGSDRRYWDRIRDVFTGLAQGYGFERIDLHALEDAELYQRVYEGSGSLYAEQLYSFTDPNGEKVTLRPEGLPSVTRAFIEHGLANEPQPTKLWYEGPMYQYVRPQSGVLRKYTQFGLTTFGSDHAAAEAELIAIGIQGLRALGIPAVVQVNSMGSSGSRERFLEELEVYLTANRTELSEASRELLRNGALLRVLVDHEPEDQKVLEGAPQLVDWLSEDDKQHFIRVLEYLDELEIPYSLSPFLVRRPEFHTRTIFEFIPEAAMHDDGTIDPNSALGAGGRADSLLWNLSGPDMPVATLALGFDRIASKMKELVATDVIPMPVDKPMDLYLAQLGDQAKRKAMHLFNTLRREGMSVASCFAHDPLKLQLEDAVRRQTRITLILGQKEVIDGTIIVREMASGIQEIVPFDRVVSEVKKRLDQETVRERRIDMTAIPQTPSIKEVKKGKS